MNTVEFDGIETDVTGLISFLDNIHDKRGNKNSRLKIVIPAAASQPELAIAAIIKYADRWNGVMVLGMHYTRTYHLNDSDEVDFISPFFSKHDNEMFNESEPGKRCHLHALDVSFAEVGAAYMAMEPDALITQTTLSRNNIVSQGGSADYSYSLIGKIPSFAIQNKHQPFVGGNQVSVSIFVDTMRHDAPIYTAPKATKSPEVTAIFARISWYVTKLLVLENRKRNSEGLTVQMGVGVMPNFITAMAAKIGIIKHVWSEVIIDAMTALKCDITGTLVLGSQELFDWVNDNSKVQLLGVEKTNNQEIINDLKLVSIVQAMAVTLDGGTIVGIGKRHSGPGGAPNFGRAMGATRIIVLPYTHYEKVNGVKTLASNIVLGAGVLDHKVLLGIDKPNYVVTEFGVAHITPHVKEDGSLFAATHEEVAKALIEIAHPDFKEQLTKEAFEAKIFAAARVVAA